MKKAEALEHWARLEPGQPIVPHFKPISGEGRTYGACGIRIDGTPEFVDAVLSRLKDVICLENSVSRLVLNRTEVVPYQDKELPNAENGAEVCYIRMAMRGPEAMMANGISRAYKEADQEFTAIMEAHLEEVTPKDKTP